MKLFRRMMIVVLVIAAFYFRLDIMNELNNVFGEYEKDVSVYYYYEQLSADDKMMYNKLLAGIHDLKESIDTNSKDEDKVIRIMNMINRDHPEIFWIEKMATSTSSKKCYATYEYTYSQKEIAKRQQEIKESTKDIIRKLRRQKDRYHRMKMAYKYIIDTVEYDLESEDNQNLYSSLLNHESVCAGYAKGMQYL